MRPSPPESPGTVFDVLRSAHAISGAYCRLAVAEASLARRALMAAAVRGGIALVLALVAAMTASASLISGLVATGLARPWAEKT